MSDRNARNVKTHAAEIDPKEERKAYAPHERMGMRMWVHPNALQIKLMHYQILSSTNGGPHG